jgi:hypothetical protein
VIFVKSIKHFHTFIDSYEIKSFGQGEKHTKAEMNYHDKEGVHSLATLRFNGERWIAEFNQDLVSLDLDLYRLKFVLSELFDVLNKNTEFVVMG